MNIQTVEQQSIEKLFTIKQQVDGTITLHPTKTSLPWLLLDEGLYHTAVCRTDISRIDGKLGQLFYRGRPISKIIENVDFLSVSQQLIFPKASHQTFTQAVLSLFILLPEIKNLLDALPSNLHPMHFVSVGISALPALENLYLNEITLQSRVAFIIAQLSVIACYYHQRQQGIKWLMVNNSHSFAERTVAQLGVDESLVQSLGEIWNLMLILHMEHDQNCSTLTARNVASTRGNPYAATVAGLSAFSGDLHGGASQRVAEMYDDILASGLSPNEYINQKLAGKERLMGFGHRVYTCWDPRAQIMFNILKRDDPLFEPIKKYKQIMLELVERVSNDTYFIDRHIYPNPDLLNGLFYRLLAVSSQMNTVMLSMGRVAGWLAHYIEHISENQPIIRPRQLPRNSI